MEKYGGRMNKEFITWNLYDHKVRILAKQIDNSEFVPDIIIGVMRGGVIPAVMLSHHFECPCKSIEWSLRDFGGRDYAKLEDIICGSLESKILIVEDIVDTGETLSEIQRWVVECLYKYPNKDKYMPIIKFASVWYNTAQDTTVDYCSVEFDRNENKDWFVFPFEKQ